MGRRASSMFVAAVLCGATVAVVPIGAVAASAKTSWSAWQHLAIGALDDAGYGPVTDPGTSSDVATSTTTTGTDETVTVLQRSFPATVGTDQVVVAESLLEDGIPADTQLVVTEADLTSGNEDIVVLGQDSDNVQSARTVKGRTMRVDVAAPSTGASPDTPGGCNVGEWNPSVVGSAFGPLIGGTSGVWCADPVTIGIISALYEYLYTGTKQVATGGNSQYGYDLYVTAWAPCDASSGDIYFQTTGIWTVNGALQSGLTSAWVPLACAPL